MVKLAMAVGRDEKKNKEKKRGAWFFPTSSAYADFVPAQMAYTKERHLTLESFF